MTALAPLEVASAAAVSITAVPALHGVPEIGFILQASGFTVYFAGDTLLIPSLSSLGERFRPIDVALLPINGLKVFGKQVVMNPLEAAQLCELLQPRFAIPTHHAFKGGFIMDTLFLKYFEDQERLPQIFRKAVQEHASGTRVEILGPGKTLTIRSA